MTWGSSEAGIVLTDIDPFMLLLLLLSPRLWHLSAYAFMLLVVFLADCCTGSSCSQDGIIGCVDASLRIV